MLHRRPSGTDAEPTFSRHEPKLRHELHPDDPSARLSAVARFGGSGGFRGKASTATLWVAHGPGPGGANTCEMNGGQEGEAASGIGSVFFIS
jgi:hypothetical protein